MSRTKPRSTKQYQLGPQARKIDSALRVLSNAKASVNLMRADRIGALAADPSVAAEVPQESRLEFARAALKGRPIQRGSMSAPTSDLRVKAFVTMEHGARLGDATIEAQLSRQTIVDAPLSSLRTLAETAGVLNISMGQTLKPPDATVDRASVGLARTRAEFGDAAHHRDGAGVLVGIIDVGGFDFSHPDFLNSKGQTRFLSIWDMGAADDGTAPVAGIGRLIGAARMNAALRAASTAGAPATELEPQSSMHLGSHGTHVASIAAGNAGVSPKSSILAVLIDLPESDWHARRSFFDSTRLALAVQWLTSEASRLDRPIAINISLGTNGHAHDSSVAVNRWIDVLLSEPGRCVCVAAGNAGQDRSLSPDDMGFVMGRIHSSGRIAARGLDHDLQWMVVGNSRIDVSDNEMEIWYGAQDRLAVSLRTPSGDWIGPLEPNEFIENLQLPDGSFVSIYNELYHPANGANTIALYLRNGIGANSLRGIPAGTWLVRLHGREIREGTFHAWIERDDPVPRGAAGPDRELWSFPSFFSETSNVDSHSVSTLACAMRVVSVANLDSASGTIHATSSQGPTRDGRFKPDIAAPGTAIQAANGFAGPDAPYVAMTGTSMSSPYVCGVTALLLAVEQTLTAAQIVGILHRTAQPLPGADFQWRNDAGFGRISPIDAVHEALKINRRDDRTKTL